MKNTIAYYLIVILFAITNILYSQNRNEPWSVSAGLNVVDLRVPSNIKELVKDYIDISENDWNYYGFPIRFSVERSLNKALSVQISSSLNMIKKGFHPSQATTAKSNFFLLDVKLNYKLAHLLNTETSWFSPFISAGVGYSLMDIGDDFKLGLGGGFSIKLIKNLGLSFESNYHHGFSTMGTDFFQHSIGLKIALSQQTNTCYSF